MDRIEHFLPSWGQSGRGWWYSTFIVVIIFVIVVIIDLIDDVAAIVFIVESIWISIFIFVYIIISIHQYFDSCPIIRPHIFPIFYVNVISDRGIVIFWAFPSRG